MEDLLKLELVAIKTDTSTATVRKWIRSGLLPATRLSRNVLRVKTSDLDRFIEVRKAAAEKK